MYDFGDTWYVPDSKFLTRGVPVCDASINHLERMERPSDVHINLVCDM